MSGISQKVSPEEVLPLLASNVFIRGYQQGTPTEFLLLIERYVSQAGELQILAGPTGTIKVSGCDDAGTLVQTLGYRMRAGCGQKNFSLETANPERAFITIDSGFPLNELEEALQKNAPFTYAYAATRVPVILHERDWLNLRTTQRRSSGTVLDLLLKDPAVDRLYWALARQDVETRQTLQRSLGLNAMLPFAPVLDFYGSEISIRSKRVLVPGGPTTEAAWKSLVGAAPQAPGEFVLRLVSKDNGWLALYFDALSRVNQAQRVHLTEGPRLKRLYDALRSANTDRPATRGVFRQATQLLVLFTRAQWEADGTPHVPGDLATWNEILHQKSDHKIVRDLSKRTVGSPEQLFESMVAYSSLEDNVGPMQLYLTLSELDRERQPSHRLSSATVRLLADGFSQFSDWYLIFTEFPDLDDASVARFVQVAKAVDKNPNQKLRANLLGTFQSTVGLWQILARQGEIPNADLNASWQKLIDPFASIVSPGQLFDAAHDSLKTLLVSAGSNTNFSQDEVVSLLAGPRQVNPESQRTHNQLAGRIGTILEEQRLVSIDTLFALSDGLKEMEHGAKKGDALLPLAAELREFDLPRPIFTNSEKVSWAPVIYTTHHAELQIKTDLSKVIKTPGSPAQLETARGQLVPFLRDALVGLIYAYYEPPGAQMIHHNPLLVRSHDFIGVSIFGAERLWEAPRLLGAGAPAGGGGFLMGSLTDFPYALSTIEQDFIAPANIQALIWKESVPNLLVSASLPRWWNVTPNELHAVTLYQRSGEEILMAATGNPQLQSEITSILIDCIAPQRLERIEKAFQRTQDIATLIPEVLPAETSYLAAELPKRFPDETPSWGPASVQLESLRKLYPTEASWERLSRDFGVPHPDLARNNARELLNIRQFPFAGGISSRLFGETWESSNLYWARLTDEMGYSPVALNLLVPELTRHMVEKIFATDMEDSPAMLRAMQEAGAEFRRSKVAALPAGSPSSVSVSTAKN